MKRPQFIVAVILSLAAVIASLFAVTRVAVSRVADIPSINLESRVDDLISLGEKNQSLQNQLQTQQEEINKGSTAQQIGVNLLKEIGNAAIKDDKLRDVLSKNGYSISSPTSASLPAAVPSTTP